MTKKPVIFVHIPKAAGATLTEVMRSEYGRVHRVDGYALRGQGRAAREAERAGTRAFAGNMPFGLADRLRGSYAYVTLLREPVSRIVSHYRWVLRHPESPLWPPLASSQMTLAEYAQSHPLQNLFNNGQTRVLGGWARSRMPADEGTLEAAKQNLEREFAVVGTVERFDDALEAMRRELGWEASGYRRLNVAPPAQRAAEPDALTRREIEKRNALDMELYRWAAARFERVEVGA